MKCAALEVDASLTPIGRANISTACHARNDGKLAISPHLSAGRGIATHGRSLIGSVRCRLVARAGMVPDTCCNNQALRCCQIVELLSVRRSIAHETDGRWGRGWNRSREPAQVTNLKSSGKAPSFSVNVLSGLATEFHPQILKSATPSRLDSEEELHSDSAWCAT
jgi:hypothetical protein